MPMAFESMQSGDQGVKNTKLAFPIPAQGVMKHEVFLG
jgi:hypothetical protein